MDTSFKYIIYGLVDPRTGCIVYIGKSSNGIKRIQSHSWPSTLKKTNTRSGSWIKHLVSIGLKPDYVILENAQSNDDLIDLEKFWIASIRATGAILYNHTDGGEGTLGIVYSKEQLTRRSVSRKGKKWSRPMSQEGRENIRKSCIGKKLSEETKEKIRAASVGRHVSTETMEKLRLANTGRKFSTERKNKISIALLNSKTLGIKLTDSLGGHFNSFRAAERFHNIDRKKIAKVCKGIIPEINGIKFTLKEVS